MVENPTTNAANNLVENPTTNAKGTHKFAEIFLWEKHSSGFASKMLDKMGYIDGKRLGNAENGIKEPIIVTKHKEDTNKNHKRKLLYIVSDSMLNQMDRQTD